jgi:adenylylsulfate kinase
MKIILIMGLPGSGKTTLAEELAPMLNAKRLNADEVRKEANDWDFSEEGRKRQGKKNGRFCKKIKRGRKFCCSRFYLPNA